MPVALSNIRQGPPQKRCRIFVVADPVQIVPCLLTRDNRQAETDPIIEERLRCC